MFRKEYNSPMHQIFKPHQEHILLEKFKRYSPSLIPNQPEDDDFLTWLLWLQHYGMPTRLLDWSENILVAAFFAVIDNHNEDGELWSLWPDELNSVSEIDGMALRNHRKVKFLCAEPYHSNPDQLVIELEIDSRPTSPIAFLPRNLFPRMSTQMSVFTVHPSLKDGGKTITEVVLSDQGICKYIIPKNLKSQFEQKLSYLGINHRTLFPDLEGMAKFIFREERYFGWGQPNPPKFQ